MNGTKNPRLYVSVLLRAHKLRRPHGHLPPIACRRYVSLDLENGILVGIVSVNQSEIGAHLADGIESRKFQLNRIEELHHESPGIVRRQNLLLLRAV